MNHYKLIKSLISEIRKLRAENDSLNDSIEFETSQQARIEQRNQQLRDENSRIEREREFERQDQLSKQWEREEVLKKLEKAERYGDSWGYERAKRELKKL